MTFLRSLASYHRLNVLLSGRYGYPVSSPPVTASDGRRLHNIPEIKIKPSLPQQSTFFNWAKWIVGSLLSAALPFMNKSWKRLLSLEDEAEMVAEEVESTSEVVEKVATVAEKVLSDVAEKMQEGGRLKGVVLFVEEVAKEAAEEARLTQDIIHKVDELKDEMEELIGKKNHAGKDEGHNKKEREYK